MLKLTFDYRMKHLIPLLICIVCGCVSIHPHMISVEAKVEAYHPQAMHEDYDDGGWATYDAVVFSILSGVATFADGDSPRAYPAGMIQNATSQLWQSTEDKEATPQYICML